MNNNSLMDILNEIGLITLEDFKNISEEFLIGKIPCSPNDCRKIYRELVRILKPQTKIFVGGYNKYGKMGLGEINAEKKYNEYTELLINENIIDVATSDTQTLLLNNNNEIYHFGHNGKNNYVTYQTETLPFMNLLNPNNDNFKLSTLNILYNYELSHFNDEITYNFLDNEYILIQCNETNRTISSWELHEQSHSTLSFNRPIYFPIYFDNAHYNNSYINERIFKIYITNIELELLTPLSSVLSIPNQGESTLKIKATIERISQNKNITIDISNISSSDNYEIVENEFEYIVDLGDITNNNDFNSNIVSINGFWISSNLIYQENEENIIYNRLKIEFLTPLKQFNFNKKFIIRLELYNSNFNIKNDVLSDNKYELSTLNDNNVYIPTKITTLKQYNSYTYLNGIKKISAGYNHMLLLDNKNYVYSRGTNLYGELGDGKSTYMIDFNIDTYYQLSNEPLYTNVPSTIFSTIVFDYNNIYFNNVYVENIHNENIYISSDRRIKKNITDVSDSYALDIIRKIETKEYEYVDKKLKGNDKAIGFIAQDVKKYFPQAVRVGENNVLTYIKLEKYNWKNNNNNYELKIDKGVVPYKIYSFYTLQNEILNSVNYINTIEYTDYNIYIFNINYDELYIGIYKTINDFHFLQKNKLFTLHHSGLQQLYKNMNKTGDDINKLKERLNLINQ